MSIVTVSLRFAPSHQILSALQAPKVALIHILAGLLAAVWLVQWGLTRPGQEKRSVGLRRWLAVEPARWVLVMALCFAVVNLVSAAFSPIWHVSLWGKWPLSDGYSLYNQASYFVLFFAIATHLRSRHQLMRLALTITGAAVIVSLVATLQHVGVNLWGSSSLSRVNATFGNPIFAGQYLVLTIPVSLGLAMVTLRRKPPSWPLAVMAVALGLQLGALYFTGSRGPWIGVAAALAIFIAASLLRMGTQRTRSLALVLSLSAVVATGLALLPATGPGGGPTPFGRVTEASAQGLEMRMAIWGHPPSR